MENSSIKCHVGSCRYNSANYCSLKDITVGNTTQRANCKED
ncbi:MAG: DUF1540 domain-containing protein, partial [Clostridiales bacterium]|nr:DUF1540 domain-containing protein [Clostridiales bacterium]